MDLKILVILIAAAHGAGCRNAAEMEYESLYSIGGSVLGVTTVVDSLDVPWEICWGPDDNIWFTEQSGSISRYDPRTNVRKRLLFIKNTYRMRTSGLLGMALHTDMKRYPYVFIAYTARSNTERQVSRVMRFTYRTDTLTDPLLILEYAAWSGHFGARVVVAPDGKLMVATGDGAQFENAQNIKSPHGKILRFNIDGTVPDDNPVAGSPVWVYGLRNPQGMAYSAGGTLYSSDHGDATDDEVNRIIRGRNYGWPHIEGYPDREKEADFARQRAGTEEPMIAWTPTVAPGHGYHYIGKRLWSHLSRIVGLLGRMADRYKFGPRKLILTGILFGGIAFVAFGMMTDVWHFYFFNQTCEYLII